MSIKITSGASLQRMQNAITQANMALNHNMEPNIKGTWEMILAKMIRTRKQAFEQNEVYKEMKKWVLSQKTIEKNIPPRQRGYIRPYVSM